MYGKVLFWVNSGDRPKTPWTKKKLRSKKENNL